MDLKEQAQKRHEEARTALAAVVDLFESRLAELPEDASADDVQVISDEMTAQLEAAEELVTRTKTQLEQTETLARAREASAGLIPAGELTVNEQPEYARNNPHKSYFGDLYALRTRGDQDALRRLQRNTQQTIEGNEKRGTPLLDAEGRAMSSSLTAGGDFLPPLYFGDLYANFRRARRVAANLVRNAPLAAVGNTITIPRHTGGTQAAAQTADNQNLQTTDAITATLTVPVCTVAGYNDLSRQIVERSEPGLDAIIIEDLLMDYNKKVNQYVVNGSGSAGQPTGLLVQANTNLITYTSGSPTIALLYPKVLDAVRQITENVFEPTVGLLMTARRWAYILAALDSTGRPLAVANGQGPFNALGLHNMANASFVASQSSDQDMTPAGWFAGYPVWIDETIPKNDGAATNQDSIIAGAFGEHILWEDSGGPRQFTFDSILSQTAGIRVEVFGYMAFTAGRYPAATSKIAGTGLVIPTF